MRQMEHLLSEMLEERDRIERDKKRREWLEAVCGAYSLFGPDDLAAREQALTCKLRRYEQEAGEIREWIDNVPDSMARRAMRMRYLDRMSWSAIAVRMGYMSESGPRMLCAREMLKK